MPLTADAEIRRECDCQDAAARRPTTTSPASDGLTPVRPAKACPWGGGLVGRDIDRVELLGEQLHPTPPPTGASHGDRRPGISAAPSRRQWTVVAMLVAVVVSPVGRRTPIPRDDNGRRRQHGVSRSRSLAHADGDARRVQQRPRPRRAACASNAASRPSKATTRAVVRCPPGRRRLRVTLSSGPVARWRLLGDRSRRCPHHIYNAGTLAGIGEFLQRRCGAHLGPARRGRGPCAWSGERALRIRFERSGPVLVPQEGLHCPGNARSRPLRHGSDQARPAVCGERIESADGLFGLIGCTPRRGLLRCAARTRSASLITFRPGSTRSFAGSWRGQQPCRRRDGTHRCTIDAVLPWSARVWRSSPASSARWRPRSPPWARWSRLRSRRRSWRPPWTVHLAASTSTRPHRRILSACRA